MFTNVILATVRTVVPAAVGSAMAFAAREWGVVVPESLAADWTAALVVALTTGYYVLVALLERRVHPAFGWLLGAAQAPAYPAAEARKTDGTW